MIHFCLHNVDVPCDLVSWMHFEWGIDVKHCLLPMGLLFVRGGRQVDDFASMGKQTVKPSDKSMNHSISFNVQDKVAVELEILFGNLYF